MGRGPGFIAMAAAAAVVAALAAKAAAQSSTMQPLKSPRLAEIARGSGSIPDTLLDSRPMRALAPSG
jgi:hypothetical protein